jgi:hypothetical protein
MQTREDPVLEEVRQVRREISARFGHDPARVVEYYLQLQERYAERLLRTPVQEKSDRPAA